MNLIRCFFALAISAVGGAAAVHPQPPAVPDPAKHYLIYLHGAILTGTDGTAVSPQFGHYDYAGILRAFEQTGFEVISEIRSDDDVERGAIRILGWIDSLKRGGVPSSRIAVVGASMGGVIAGRVSHALEDREIGYVLLASLYQMGSYPPVALSGRVLAIHDRSDLRIWVAGEYLTGGTHLANGRSIITDTGLGHGLLYLAHEAWMAPAIEWLKNPRN